MEGNLVQFSSSLEPRGQEDRRYGFLLSLATAVFKSLMDVCVSLATASEDLGGASASRRLLGATQACRATAAKFLCARLHLHVSTHPSLLEMVPLHVFDVFDCQLWGRFRFKVRVQIWVAEHSCYRLVHSIAVEC